MEALVLDEKRSKWVIVAAYVASALGLLGSIAFHESLPDDFPQLLAAGSAMLGFLAPLVPARRRYRRSELDITPGRVRIRRRRSLPFDITAKDVVGATTAITPEGKISLVLSLAKRPYAPVVIQVSTEKQIVEVRRALGLGHDGVGSVGFATKTSQARATGAVLNVLGALGVLGMALTLFGIFGSGAIGLGVLAIIVALFIGLPTYAGGGVGDTVTLQADGVHILGNSLHLQASGFGASRYRTIPWTAIRSVVRADRALELVLTSDQIVRLVLPGLLGPSREVVDALATTMEDAVRRANGLAAPRELTAEALQTLQRAPHERRGDWLARLDAVGRTLTVGAGYRGSAFDEADLWRVVEDPDAEADLRIAAARALSAARREEQTKTRIDAAVAASARDGYLEQRFRIAVDCPDVERAGAQMDELEAAMEGAAMRRAVGLFR